MSGLEELKKMLADRAGFETTEESASANQVRLMGRVQPNAMPYWILVKHHILCACSEAVWKADISKVYFIRKLSTGKKLFYSWRVLLQAPQIEAYMPTIIATIHSTPRPSKVELQEYPLPGGDAHRKSYANGKGAASAESAPSSVLTAGSRVGGRQ